MNIAVVAGFPPDPFGEAHYAGQTFLSLARQFPEVNVLVIAHKNNSAPDREQLLPNLQIRRITQPYSRIRATVALLPLLFHLIRFRPQIVHFQGTHTPRYGGLFGEPVTILIGVLRLLGIKVVFTAHSIWLRSDLEKLWERHNLFTPLDRCLTWLYGANLRHVASWSNVLSFAVAGEASPLVDIYKEEYSLLSRKITSEIHPCTGNLISSERQLEAKRSLRFSDCFIVSAMGFIRPDKGYHLILDCADELLIRFPNLIFVIAGNPQGLEGEHYAKYLEQKRLAIRDKERIILKTEYLSNDDFSTYMEASDIVIVPYPQVMGPSGPIHHALGRGKPVIASAQGHNLGLVDVCKLVSAGDAQALGQALDELLSSPQQMADYRNRSIAYGSRYTWDHLAQQYATQYRLLRA